MAVMTAQQYTRLLAGFGVRAEVISERVPPGQATASVRALQCGGRSAQVFCGTDEVLTPASLAHALRGEGDSLTPAPLGRILRRTQVPAGIPCPGVVDVPLYATSHVVEQPTLDLPYTESVCVRIAGADVPALLATEHHLITDPNVLASELLENYRAIKSDRPDVLRAVNEFTGRRFQTRLEQISFIPPMRQTAQRILEFQQDQTGDADDLAGIVSMDPALAAQVMSWARSAYFGARNINSIKDAVTRAIGVDRVMNLALGLALSGSFGNEIENSHYTRLRDYWVRAVFTALLADRLAAEASRHGVARLEPGMAYLAGLLHNFGEGVLARFFPQQLDGLERCEALNPGLPPVLAQRLVLGLSEDQIGGFIAHSWGLQEPVVCAVRYSNDGQSHIPFPEEQVGYARLINLTLSLLGRAELPATPIICDTLGEPLERALGASVIERALEHIVEHRTELLDLADSISRSSRQISSAPPVP